MKTGSRARNRTVDFLKGAGILLVLITHFSWTPEERQLFVFPFIIDMAIPMFMIITGFTYSLSFDRRGVDSFEKAYDRGTVLPRLLRYTIPFLLAAAWELADDHVYLSAEPQPAIIVIQWFMRGMVGHGSYYYPVLVQLIFIFPAIYFTVRKQPRRGLWICLLVNLAYEVMKWAYRIPEECYRLIALRYVFVIAAGVHAYCGGTFKRAHALLISAAGAAFIAAVKYLNYAPVIINFWTGTSAVAALWIVPAVSRIVRRNRLRFMPLEVLGRASYHIFLVQMIYYVGYCELLGQHIPNRAAHLVAGMAVCIAAGSVLYFLDSRCLSGLYARAGRLHGRRKGDADPSGA